jgi:predicted metal-dependent peptidase
MNTTTSQAMPANEWRDICMELQQFHAVFYKLWEIGKPLFTTDISTACVTFSKDGNYLNFLFNPDFWNSCTKYDKLFVICHECMHIILNHGLRFKNAEDDRVANVSMDVAINHSLVNRFGFDRKSITDSENYCWIETVFNKQKYNGQPVSDDESSEFYYNLLLKNKAKNKKQNSNQPQDQASADDQKPTTTKEPKTVDSHEFRKDGNNSSKIMKKIGSSLSKEEKKDLANKSGKQFQYGGQLAGIGVGSMEFLLDDSSTKIKRKWESVIINWTKKYLKESDCDKEQWARQHRRHQLLEPTMFLPSDMEIEDINLVKDKIDVYFFMDTSGSCLYLKDRFFQAARSLDPKRFNIRLFCFDTVVHETTIESRKIYGGGGTCFRIIENFIQQQKKDGSYPDAVWVITDGYGTNVSPEKPDRWYWFVSDFGTEHYIPQKSKRFLLKDFN